MYGALSWFSYLWDLDKQEQKGVGMLKSHQLGVVMQVTKEGSFDRKGRFSLCNTTVL